MGIVINSSAWFILLPKGRSHSPAAPWGPCGVGGRDWEGGSSGGKVFSRAFSTSHYHTLFYVCNLSLFCPDEI